MAAAALVAEAVVSDISTILRLDLHTATSHDQITYSFFFLAPTQAEADTNNETSAHHPRS